LNSILFALIAFQDPGAAPPQANPLILALPWIAIFAIFYFLLIRPQSKRHKKHQQMVKALQKGDRVVTTGGIHGSIQGIHEDRDVVVLEIADKVRIEVTRGSITKVSKE
jgi:preprotein translocase subunit YajC